MVSVASAGPAERIAARSLFKTLRAGSGTPEIGTAAARNYVLKNGAVTITGLKTFQDGAEFGSGNKAATGLVRLPNLGAVKWRKADNSGDLGMALNASNHVAMDAIIDFAVGQTFGAFSYPDATTTSKGIVQIDPVGGLAVASGY